MNPLKYNSFDDTLIPVFDRGDTSNDTSPDDFSHNVSVTTITNEVPNDNGKISVYSSTT